MPRSGISTYRSSSPLHPDFTSNVVILAASGEARRQLPQRVFEHSGHHHRGHRWFAHVAAYLQYGRARRASRGCRRRVALLLGSA
ncbi:MAG: hypothetical protein U5K76_10740 [Woeseiaceae bacterium]|nr:hypothetical protein [Woeseiaceae bacterium]